RTAFFTPPFTARLRAAFADFRDPGEIEPYRRTAAGEPFEITASQISFGAGLHPAHGMHNDLHSCPEALHRDFRLGEKQGRFRTISEINAAFPLQGPAPATFSQGCRSRGPRVGRHGR